ncbi:MAG: DUF5009 domain-containing protein [Bryobacteraceae bacterium]
MDAQPQRLVSLDAFRGAIMALMVLVNTSGGDQTYAPLQHAEWNGWTPTDVVFPSFLWIVGLAITLSLGKRLETGGKRGPLFLQVVRRTVILFLLGMAIYAYPAFNLGTQRILGVLQRIALCYLFASVIYMTTKIRGQIMWIAGLLVGYWLLMMLVPVPGYGTGRLDVEGNLAHYVDWNVLGSHNYAGTKTWDPEGIVSTLPALATALLGIMAGHILRLKKPLSERTTWLFVMGLLLLTAGLICDHWMPINKKLWTTSFSLFMAGLDSLMFALFLWMVDGVGWKRLTKPLTIMGMNAIAVYLASEFGDEILSAIRWGSGSHTMSLRRWLYQDLFATWLTPINASLGYAIAFTLLMFAIAYGMYRRRWFLRV